MLTEFRRSKYEEPAEEPSRRHDQSKMSTTLRGHPKKLRRDEFPEQNFEEKRVEHCTDTPRASIPIWNNDRRLKLRLYVG